MIMAKGYLFSLLMVGFASEEFTHCLEYRDILAKYQTQMNDYESCITKNAEQTAQIRSYENVITSGLQHQVDALRRDQSWL